MTRYGYVELNNHSLGNAVDYLAKIDVTSGNPSSMSRHLYNFWNGPFGSLTSQIGTEVATKRRNALNFKKESVMNPETLNSSKKERTRRLTKAIQ